MITVVCDFSAVKDFQAESGDGITASVSTLCLRVHACIHIACLLTASQFTHITAPLHQLINYL